MVLQIGDMVGPYKIAGQIGQGGMATVYRAHHDRLDRSVAIKVMHQGFLEDPSFLARFEREAKIVARLEHPNIVPVYDYNEYQGQPYLVMKLVEGRTLKQYMFKAGITPDEIYPLMKPICEALDFAHEEGVLHRDIKPSNIIIDNRAVPYLMDFGLARITRSGESTMSADMMLGTPHYISPEQAKGDKYLDSRTDIYSMGVILYELATGQVPFTADTPYAIVHDHIYAAPPLPSAVNPDLPPAIDYVILKALAKQPSDRFATATEMLDAFRDALSTSSDPAADQIPASQSYVTPQPPAIPGPPRAPEMPSSIEPQAETRKTKDGKQVKADFEFDISKVDWGNLGKRLEEGIRKGSEYITDWASQIEEKMDQGFEQGSRKYASEPPNMVLSEEDRMRLRIEQRMKKRDEFYTHVGIYFVVMALIWIFFGLFSLIPVVGGFCQIIPIIVALAWGVGVFSHWMEYNSKYGSGAEKREAMIEQEIARSRAAKQKNGDKLKNDVLELYEDDIIDVGDAGGGRIRLNEDGELTDSFIEEAEDPRRRRGKGRRGR